MRIQELVQSLGKRLRPRTLQEYLETHSLVGSPTMLSEIGRNDLVPSLVLVGPPGSGKTTLARLLSRKRDHIFRIVLCSPTTGIGEAERQATLFHLKIDRAQKECAALGKRTLLFIDEIHFCHPDSQTALIEPLEKGFLTIIGATIASPKKFLIPPLAGRLEMILLREKDPAGVSQILQTILDDEEHGLGRLALRLDEDAKELICQELGNTRDLIRVIQRVVLQKVEENEKAGLPFWASPITRHEIEDQLQKRAEARFGISGPSKPFAAAHHLG